MSSTRYILQSAVMLALCALAACGDDSSSSSAPDTTWRCRKYEGYDLCSCQQGGYDYGLDTCSGVCCANGVDTDGVTKTCLCNTPKAGETCEQWLSALSPGKSLVASCPVQ